MFKVQFYSAFTQKYIDISKHKTLVNAVKKARFYYTEGGYNDISIVSPDGTRLDMYGAVCYYCSDTICEGAMNNECQNETCSCKNKEYCSGTDCHIE